MLYKHFGTHLSECKCSCLFCNKSTFNIVAIVTTTINSKVIAEQMLQIDMKQLYSSNNNAKFKYFQLCST